MGEPVRNVHETGFERRTKEHVVREIRRFARKHSIRPLLPVEAEALNVTPNAEKYAVRLQSQWRGRRARYFVASLLQKTRCVEHRDALREGRAPACTAGCRACELASGDAQVEQRVRRLQFQDVALVLFAGSNAAGPRRLKVFDAGDNWNQRFQEALELSEDTRDERIRKLLLLNGIDRDFCACARRYAETIINEYFLHAKDKSMYPSGDVGGHAGGEKYVFRGILFKLADGDVGPWHGSDEAAAKAAGHDLRGNMAYYAACREAGVDREVRFPLIALVDYKGFRMTAQALLPLRKGDDATIRIGTADGGKTVHDGSLDREFYRTVKRVSEHMGLKEHNAGLVPRNLKKVPMTCDMEGHVGLDRRRYLLDFARYMPPEHPSAARHLNKLVMDGSRVSVKVEQRNGHQSLVPGFVSRAHRERRIEGFGGSVATDHTYDVVAVDGTLLRRVPREDITDRKLSIFWRLLRPEFVKQRGRGLLSDAQLARAEARPPPAPAPAPPADGGRPPLAPAVPAAAGRHDKWTPPTDRGLAPLVPAAVGGYDEWNGAPAAASAAAPAAAPTAAPAPPVEEARPLRGLSDEMARGGTTGGGYSAFTANTSFAEDEAPVADEHASYATPATPSANTRALRDLSDKMARGEAATTSYSAFYARASFTQDPEHASVYENLAAAGGGGGGAGGDGGPPPLNPDALSTFITFDAENSADNEAVRRATELLLEEVVPAVARKLTRMRPEELEEAKLNAVLHADGVNMRHVGLVRRHVGLGAEHARLRRKLFVEVVARALKQMLRVYLRRWIKSEASTSELGIASVVAAFLNLVSGSATEAAREQFWNDRVVMAIKQRFGAQSLWREEYIDLMGAVRDNACVAEVVDYVCTTCGVRLTDDALSAFRAAPDGFHFSNFDVHALESTIKYPGAVDYKSGELLLELTRRPGADRRHRERLQALAAQSFRRAAEKVPSGGFQGLIQERLAAVSSGAEEEEGEGQGDGGEEEGKQEQSAA